MRADHTGNALVVGSDVKERGIIVGSVASVHSNGEGAIVKLSLSPGRVKDIPNDVTAQILPKTLFGEQYVSLSIPANSSRHRDQGRRDDPQDRSQGALETEKVLGDLLPLLNRGRPGRPELDADRARHRTAQPG